MNRDEAREILLLYRPGTTDDQDPDVLEARQVAEQDPELAQWFQAQQAVTLSLRSKLKSSQPPDGLLEQILSESKSHGVPHSIFSRRLGVPAMAAALFVVLALTTFLYLRLPGHDSLADFRDQMVRVALRVYPRMDVETSDLNRIRQYLNQQNAYGDYVLPPSLEKAATTGCAVLKDQWKGKKVSMICFTSGKPRDPAQKADVFLFIVAHDVVPNAPTFPAAKPKQVNAAATISWTEGGKTYVLIGDGDENFLKRFY